MINITKPVLPPLEEFIPYLKKIWESGQLTNKGPFHEQFEKELSEFLGVGFISLFTNGTLALISAFQALRITGEVITTPYSFVATSHSLLWNGIKPVFVDIDRHSLNIDPLKIEAAITPQTTAILAVHCYGHPCDVNAIQEIADRYNLKVIYDAAHAFGVEEDSGSILNHGDLSILSFHATKVFNTFEGGAIVSPDKKTKQRIDYLKNFGFANEISVVAPGINGKMNEFSAALGLLQLKYVDESIASRKKIDTLYREGLKGIPGIRLTPMNQEKVYNYSYFPIFINQDYPISRDALYSEFKEIGINVRRYFYPLISEFSMYKMLHSASRDNLQVALEAADQVLCLPIFPDLDQETISKVIDLIRDKSRF
ncbi:MAG TPA: DegT/DnrJ/EryC1/StrS family aminotransferase [Herbaspirillum sp.]